MEMNAITYITFSSWATDGFSGSIDQKVKEEVQYVNLGPGCLGQKTILHKLCHALGMWHEQSRPDWDEYVQIVESNIQDDRKHNFMKHNVFQVDS